MTTGDFIRYSVGYGLKAGEFDTLNPHVKRKLIRLMARIAEKSFRRGFQHGVITADNERTRKSAAKLRFDLSLDRSPYTDNHKRGHKAIERLFMECGVLHEIGFDEESK